MAGIKNLLGADSKLVNKDGDEKTVGDLFGDGVKTVGLYFSAHWCPPCRGFTPKLAEFYTNFKATDKGKEMDMVFISSDRDEASFNEYKNEMPWYSLNFADRDRKAKLSKKFKVQGIPTLVIVDAESGKVLCRDGRSAVMKDMKGANYPWPSKTVAQILDGTCKAKDKDDNKKVLDDQNLKEKIQGKVLGIYFSAHWCPPCRGFTPDLISTYNKLVGDGKDFEILFASWDRDEDSFDEYYETMPWLAWDNDDPRAQELGELFGVEGIPSLIILDKDGKVITTNGRAAVGNDPDGNEFPWYPKPVEELTGNTAASLNDSPCILLMTNKKPELISVMKECEDIIKEDKAKAQADEDMDDICFMYEGEKTGELSQRLREFIDIKGEKPCLALINIQDQEKYVTEKDSFTKDDIKDLIDQFRAQTLKCVPLKN